MDELLVRDNGKNDIPVSVHTRGIIIPLNLQAGFREASGKHEGHSFVQQRTALATNNLASTNSVVF